MVRGFPPYKSMKKFISIIIILAIMLGSGIAEITLSSRLFKELNAQLCEVNVSLKANEQNPANPDTIAKMDSIMEKWEKSKELALMFSNHSIMRSLDEKLVSLKSWIECGGYEDARALCEVSIELTEDLIDETYPVITNLF